VQEYYKRFIAMGDVNKTLGTNIHDDHGFVEVIAKENGEDTATLTEEQKTDYMEQGCDRMMAINMLMGANREHFGSTIEDFKHVYLMDRKNRYPKSIHECHTLLKGWRKSTSKQHPTRVVVSFNTVGDEDEDGAALVNNARKGKYGGPPCIRLGRDNHSMEKCIAKRHEDGTMLHTEGGWSEAEEADVSRTSNDACCHKVHEIIFLQPTNDPSLTGPTLSSNRLIPAIWILIDSQSTIDIFSNGELLTQVRQINTTMHIRCNAGVKSTNLRGYLSGYGWVWYFPDGIVNILSLSRVKEKYCVTFNSASNNSFHVPKPGKILKFRGAT
jgi:hypothetical protein